MCCDDTPATAAMTEVSGAIDSFLHHQIIKRAGEPEDIAHVALFFASDEASFSAGRNLVVVGAPGRTAGRKIVRETVPAVITRSISAHRSSDKPLGYGLRSPSRHPGRPHPADQAGPPALTPSGEDETDVNSCIALSGRV
ncbi:SDR family oxidoreductase [Streptomyces sp. JNUCC 63]